MSNPEGNSTRTSTLTGAKALIEQRVAEAEARKKENAKQLQEQGYSEADVMALAEEAAAIREEIRSDKQPHRGMASNSIIELVQHELFSGEAAGHYTKTPIRPATKIPTGFTRFPFFVPHRRSKQLEMIDKNLSMEFKTPWGKGRKYGAPLNIDDEDVFLALGRMLQYELRGDTSLMPISVQDPMKRGPHANVHTLIATPVMIREQLGLKNGGGNNEKIYDSIERLGSTRLKFEAISGLDEYTGAIFSLFDVAWQRYEYDGVYYIQFSPIITEWLEKAFTYIDWDVRMALPNATSKAVHRFLSGQRKDYEISLEKLKGTIMNQSPVGEFKRELKAGFEVMKSLGWLKSWNIEGTGRKIPFKVIIER